MGTARLSLLGTCLMLALYLPARTDPSAPSPNELPPRLDNFGDPLPAGALNRLALQRVQHDDEAAAKSKRPVTSLAFSGNGRTVASANGGRMIRFWDTASGKELQRNWTVLAGSDRFELIPGQQHSVVYGSDEQAVISHGRILTPIGIWWPFRNEVEFVTADGKGYNYGMFENHRLALAIDGRSLAVPLRSTEILIWDPVLKKDLGSIDIRDRQIVSLGFAPDGKTLAAGVGEDEIEIILGRAKCSEVQLWDVPSGKLLRKLSCPPVPVWSLAFSPDGLILAAACGDGLIRLWNPATAELRQALGRGTKPILSVAFSPDGRGLATAGKDRCVTLWETATGKPRRQWTGHAGAVHHVAFAPDGRTLGSGSADGSILLWDVLGLRTESIPARPATESEREQVWKALASADAMEAFAAVRTLVAHPREAVAILTNRLKPAVALSGLEQVPQVIADLDSPQFAVRIQAMKALESYGEAAEPAMRTALTQAPTLEKRRRLEALIANINGPITGTEQLRQIRALEVLEYIGNAAAEKLLEKMTQGDVSARSTREAKAAMERLAARRILHVKRNNVPNARF